jgi:peptide chain release factor 3
VNVTGLEDPLVRGQLDDQTYATVREQIEMIELAGAEFDHEKVLAGKLSPVFFGSGVNNFGVQLLLDSFLEYSARPGAGGGLSAGRKIGKHRSLRYPCQCRLR